MIPVATSFRTDNIAPLAEKYKLNYSQDESNYILLNAEVMFSISERGIFNFSARSRQLLTIRLMVLTAFCACGIFILNIGATARASGIIIAITSPE